MVTAHVDEPRSGFTLAPASFQSVSSSSSDSSSSSSPGSSGSTSSSSSSSPRQQRHAGPSLSQDWLNGAKTATAGGIAGAFAKSCTAPLARLTILYQVQGFSGTPAAGGAGGHAAAAAAAAPPGMRQAFMQVVRQEGPAALWKGNLVTILHRLPYSSINFYTYESTQKLLEHHLPSATNFARAWMSGATAGLVACSAAYPLDLVRTRFAAQTQGHYYSGIWSTLRCIVQDEGALGLYRGLGATLLQVVPSLALNFSLYDSIRNSCMAVHLRMQRLRKQQQLAAVVDAAAAEASSSGGGSSSSPSGSKSSSSSSRAHSLAVASSVDQGMSYSQMLLWHLDDARDAAEAYASSSDSSSSSNNGGPSSWWGGSGNSSGASGSSSSSSGGWGDAAAAAAEMLLDSSAEEQRRSSHAGASSSGSTPGSLEPSSSSGSVGGVRRVRHADVPAGISLASGCVSGFLTATATFPLDVVRRRMQVYGRRHQGQPVSYRQIIEEITSRGRGFRGFYVGILPEYCKVVPGVAIAFCTYEQLKKWLHVEP